MAELLLDWTWLWLALTAVLLRPTTSETSCPCGWTNRGRIVGGTETGKHEYPWVTGLKRHNSTRPFCGGTVISEWHVLTAAHCTEGFSADDLQLVLGEHDVTKAEKSKKMVGVAKIIQHKKYTPKPIRHDISLLVIAERVPLSQNVGPACVPTERLSLVHERVKVLGWGLTANKKGPSDVLREVTLPVIEPGKCIKFWPNFKEETMMCTHLKDKDSCKGDSGGPVIWLDPETNRYTLVGLVSYGAKCAELQPGVSTDVSAYLSWLHRRMEESKPGTKTCGRVVENSEF